MRLILCDRKIELCNLWTELFRAETDVEIVNASFETLNDYDCIVSPANSFGLMDGGFDAALIRYFGAGLMHNVQQYILREYAGEQPVGTSFVIETGHSEHKYLAHTPTMRVPKVIANTDVVYNSMRAMLLAVQKYHVIKTVLCPGLGTATGKVPLSQAARQMYLAYQSLKNPPNGLNWSLAQKIEAQVKATLTR
ncbi:MAG: putative phosphatase, C-terminal domain of histone macro like protein [Firmicutes bacterium]|nr:putative phosphatase, C-terminal domain of histone macro like protein [Bacillota bacterium]